MINRWGSTMAAAGAHARACRRRSGCRGVLGVNVGANKDSADRIADYARGVADDGAASRDYVTINISSPNTPGLRDLQDEARSTTARRR